MDRLPADAWRHVRLVLLRYPESKVLYDQIIEESQTRTSDNAGSGSKPVHSDPTATAAIKLYNDARFQRINREVTAVETAVMGLDSIEKEVIRRRFWNHRPGVRKVCSYSRMRNIGYSRRQMQRIVRRVTEAVAILLGEI